MKIFKGDIITLVLIITISIFIGAIVGSYKKPMFVGLFDKMEGTLIFEKETYIPNSAVHFYGLSSVKDRDILRYEARIEEYGINLRLLNRIERK